MRTVPKYLTQIARIKNTPSKVQIFEVAARDGLQNEKKPLSIDFKVQLINKLSESGFKNIEVGSFVNPKAVPQMANSDQVYQAINKIQGITYSVLVPNLKGFQSALKLGVQEIAVFISASEAFSQKNINCSIQESLNRIKPVIEEAKQNGIKTRGYLSCIAGCPYGEIVSSSKVCELSLLLLEMGCYQISLGDTIGCGQPQQISELLDTMNNADNSLISKLAVHFHNTNQKALENIVVALEKGITTVDSSVYGLGGCPYGGPNAKGNVATEDVIQLMNVLGIETGINLEKLKEIGEFLNNSLGYASRAMFPL